jgi:hypothetical protein
MTTPKPKRQWHTTKRNEAQPLHNLSFSLFGCGSYDNSMGVKNAKTFTRVSFHNASDEHNINSINMGASFGYHIAFVASYVVF